MSSTSETAAVIYNNGFNCAQSVLAAFCEKYGMNKDIAVRMSSALGGGFHLGELCGAASAAVLVIGLKYGHGKPENQAAKEKCTQKTIEFLELFRRKNKSIICREIKEARSCTDVVKSAAAFLEELGY